MHTALTPLALIMLEIVVNEGRLINKHWVRRQSNHVPVLHIRSLADTQGFKGSTFAQNKSCVAHITDAKLRR